MLISFISLAQQRVILDTDIDSDVDDVAALAMLLKLAISDKITLADVIITIDHPFVPVCTNAINQHLGFPDIPVGYKRDQVIFKKHSKYTRQISEEFPHQLGSYQDAQDTTILYRKLLAEKALKCEAFKG